MSSNHWHVILQYDPSSTVPIRNHYAVALYPIVKGPLQTFYDLIRQRLGPGCLLAKLLELSRPHNPSIGNVHLQQGKWLLGRGGMADLQQQRSGHLHTTAHQPSFLVERLFAIDRIWSRPDRSAVDFDCGFKQHERIEGIDLARPWGWMSAALYDLAGGSQRWTGCRDSTMPRFGNGWMRARVHCPPNSTTITTMQAAQRSSVGGLSPQTATPSTIPRPTPPAPPGLWITYRRPRWRTCTAARRAGPQLPRQPAGCPKNRAQLRRRQRTQHGEFAQLDADAPAAADAASTDAHDALLAASGPSLDRTIPTCRTPVSLSAGNLAGAATVRTASTVDIDFGTAQDGQSNWTTQLNFTNPYSSSLKIRGDITSGSNAFSVTSTVILAVGATGGPTLSFKNSTLSRGTYNGTLFYAFNHENPRPCRPIPIRCAGGLATLDLLQRFQHLMRNWAKHGDFDLMLKTVAARPFHPLRCAHRHGQIQISHSQRRTGSSSITRAVHRFGGCAEAPYAAKNRKTHLQLRRAGLRRRHQPAHRRADLPATRSQSAAPTPTPPSAIRSTST